MFSCKDDVTLICDKSHHNAFYNNRNKGAIVRFEMFIALESKLNRFTKQILGLIKMHNLV